jgi:hypothetical protein
MVLVDSVHDVHGGAGGALAKFLDVAILVTSVPCKGGGSRGEFKDYRALGGQSALEHVNVATADHVPAARRENIWLDSLLLGPVALRVKNFCQVDHVRRHRPSYIVSWE